jgi:2'-5' RNA ligase
VNTFIALLPDDATRDRLQAVAERLAAWGLPAHWSDPADYHLTLLFVGDVSEEDRQFLPAAVDDVAQAIAADPPSLRLTGLGATGTRQQSGTIVPRQVFAAVADPTAVCTAWHGDLSACVDEPPSRAFIPHVTLGRPAPVAMDLPLFRDWPHLLEAHGVADWGPFTVEAVALLQSQRGVVPRYRALERWVTTGR